MCTWMLHVCHWVRSAGRLPWFALVLTVMSIATGVSRANDCVIVTRVDGIGTTKRQGKIIEYTNSCFDC